MGTPIDLNVKEYAKVSMGALPAPGREWVQGKTAATVAFVTEAEKAVKELQEQIDAAKEGKVSLEMWRRVTVTYQDQSDNEYYGRK